MTTSLLSVYSKLASPALDRAIASLAARIMPLPPSHEVTVTISDFEFSTRIIIYNGHREIGLVVAGH